MKLHKFNLFLISASLLLSSEMFAQDRTPFASQDLPQGDARAWSCAGKGLRLTWASADVLYLPDAQPPRCERPDTVLHAWRGERIGLEALLYSQTDTAPVSLRLRSSHAAKAGSKAFEAEPHFLCYVVTDSFKTCGIHPDSLKPYLVPDCIDNAAPRTLQARTLQPLWLTVEVARDAPKGICSDVLEVVDASGKVVASLNFSIDISSQTLPLPKDQRMHLDFWQQPYSVSRYYGVEPWSQRHIDLLRPYLELLSRAGQKVTSAILFYEPWGEQSNDKFQPMVETTRLKDGTWQFAYDIFDKWVSLTDSYGMAQQINCFSMVPWDMSFRYFDAAADSFCVLKTTTATPEYRELWTAFLKDFSRHLRSRGWLERTRIAMDERGLQSMLEAWDVAQAAAPELKMALAGNYHPELAEKLADYCIPFGKQFPPKQRQYRRENKLVTTFYTCCTESHPNVFSNSDPAEAVSLPVYALAYGYDGYLHWSWLNWTDNPLRDTRFKFWAPGDSYIVYPDARSSVRWERFIEGIQLAEKVRLLSDALEDKCPRQAQRLSDAVKGFTTELLSTAGGAAQALRRLRKVMGEAEKEL